MGEGKREFAIEVDSRHVVHRLKKVFEHDWDHSHAIDLSDEGIHEDLERHGRNAGDL